MDIPIPNQEGDIPVPAPLSSAAAYGGEGGGGGGCGGQGHMLSHRRQHHHHHHHHHHPTSHINANSPPGTAIDGPLEDQQHHHVMVGYNSKSSNGSSNKVMVRYRECMKNHAAAIGGTAMDGCGEFMPSGEEGTIEALTCSACSCHRNFHRKEVDGGGGGGGGHEHSLDPWYHHHHHSPPHLNRVGRKVIVGHPHHKNMLGSHEAAALLYPTGTLIASRAPTPHQMIMPYSVAGPLPSESDEQEDDVHQGGGGGAALVPAAARPTQMVKKRYRTKFTQEQKEKMLSFAEKVGWKIQRQEESVVQQFCQEVGVKRRVLKVWMHNNKHSLARKNLNPPPPSSISITAATTTINNNNSSNP